MSVIEMLQEEMKKSKAFPENNFGLKVGKNWPEFVGNLLDDKDVRTELVCNFMITMMSSMNLKEDIAKDSKDAMEELARKSYVYDCQLKFLFWGIQIGKRQAEREAAAIQAAWNF